jgi:hypothetical protein
MNRQLDKNHEYFLFSVLIFWKKLTLNKLHSCDWT